MEILKKLKIQQADLNLYNPENFLFFETEIGIPSNYYLNQYLRMVLNHLDIQPKNMTSTGNRHTYASMMLAMGIDIWALSKIMGHKDITEITETYGHLIKEKAEEENKKVRQKLLQLKD